MSIPGVRAKLEEHIEGLKALKVLMLERGKLDPAYLAVADLMIQANVSLHKALKRIERTDDQTQKPRS